MDFPSKRHTLNRSWVTIVVNFTAAVLLVPATGLAQVPYNIDGIVPDANCCFEFSDPVGSVKELGPINSSGTKLRSIHSATPAMLGFTNPSSSTDIATIWLDTEVDQSGDLWLYFAWERDATSGSSVISYEFQKADEANRIVGFEQEFH